MLERGEAEPAAAFALKVINGEGEEPEYRFLLGMSLMELGEVVAAIPEFERAAEISEDWPDPYAGLAWAQFRACRFEDAKEPLEKVIAFDPGLSDAHQLRGLIAEREGDADTAIVAFAEARRLDPEAYPEPFEMDEDEFLECARKAVEELDEQTKQLLEDTGLFIQPFPAVELLEGGDPPLDPQLLGLFTGASLLEQSVQDSGHMPNTMYLFQRNLERMALDREELEKQIRITVLHEIAHHFGWSDEELEAKGFG